ncbi:hypothetical protein SmJEL517_g03157 [Synchytrium microbalum]|uniref:t-SNARE coiled-coil homology domain-containing protein n=1 Tax=Synchytrium microbalum TaxID=1806994 RepID=A0A507BZF5_9FUNG|nr:uncharacterized protein SmJEL517_g03157 [Synchytrium microbalum]TPX34177.1 hypothetical protein SmJEL517_g03157 [Synchytrium microbalum]
MAEEDLQEWEKEAEHLQSTADELTTHILERKRLKSRGLDISGIERQIATSQSTLKDGIASLEQQLSTAESRGGIPSADLKRWENMILALSKQYDRVEFLAKADDSNPDARAQLFAKQPAPAQPSAASTHLLEDDGTPLESLNNQEFLQLQDRIMQEQDNHLDELAVSIGRHKHIGLMISEELDLHADLLEETEVAVDTTRSRLGAAGRRLTTITKNTNSRGITAICILFVILIIIIVIARR